MFRTLLFSLFAAAGVAQPRFELATIKPHPIDGQLSLLADPLRIAGPRVSLTVVTLVELISAAYDVRNFQVAGAPDWGTQSKDRYDIEGKAPGEEPPTRAQARQMLQTLLADRFHLALHRDSKEFPVYHLVIGKDGTKVKPTEPGSPRPTAPLRRLPMMTLDGLIARFLNRPVIDKTGLTGSVDFTLDLEALDRDRLAIFTAVQDGLGLKLEAAKDSMPVLMVEHVERPTEN